MKNAIKRVVSTVLIAGVVFGCVQHKRMRQVTGLFPLIGEPHIRRLMVLGSLRKKNVLM